METQDILKSVFRSVTVLMSEVLKLRVEKERRNYATESIIAQASECAKPGSNIAIYVNEGLLGQVQASSRTVK